MKYENCATTALLLKINKISNRIFETSGIRSDTSFKCTVNVFRRLLITGVSLKWVAITTQVCFLIMSVSQEIADKLLKVTMNTKKLKPQKMYKCLVYDVIVTSQCVNMQYF